jgi:hypothetical protein
VRKNSGDSNSAQAKKKVGGGSGLMGNGAGVVGGSARLL